MTQEVFYRFGLRDGEIVGIDSVARGLACRCTCPHCAAPFVARKGARKTHHFAHYRSPDCTKSLETALHLLAKQILRSAERVAIPQGLSVPTVAIASCSLETNLGGIRPDVILTTDAGRELLVEVAVTHPVDDAKQRRLRDTGRLAMEISLGHLLRKGDIEDVTRAVLHNPATRRWIVGPTAPRAQTPPRRPRIPLGYFPSWSSYYNDKLRQSELHTALTQEYFHTHQCWPSQEQFEVLLTEILDAERARNQREAEAQKSRDEAQSKRKAVRREYRKQKYGW